MMKLILSLTLLWALSSTAGALQCQTCTDEQCNTEPLTCSSETACITASIRAKIPGTLEEQNFKACASSSLCPAPGFQTFSFNFGFESAVVSAKCCNTDNCNIDILPIPDSQADNNLECFTCDPVTSLCTSPLQCKGVEDSCFQATLTSGSTTSTAFGCASANLCAAASQGSLPFLQSVVNTTGVSCCGSSLCNTAKTNTTSAPTTAAPTTAAPTTAAPTTSVPTTAVPTTFVPTTAAPTTTTSGPTTITSAPTTAAPTTSTAAPTTSTASGAGCRIRLGMIHLLLGLLMFTLC